MTECCSSPPSIGTWKIYVRMPIYYPARIFYDWNDSSGQQQIEGTDYLITEELVTNENTDYIVDYTIYMRLESWYSSLPSFNYQAYHRAIGRGIVTNLTNPNSGFLWGGNIWDCPPVSLLRKNSNGALQFFTIYQCLGNSKNTTNFNYGDNRFLNLLITSIKKSNNQEVDKSYTLKIFNKAEKVYEQTRSTKPTVELRGEQCLQGEQKEYVRDYQNWKSKDYCQQYIQGNQTTLFVFSEQLNGNFAALGLAYQSSDERCSLAPIFEVDCIPCSQCPENTCQIICGDFVCCYDTETGRAIKTFPVSELC